LSRQPSTLEAVSHRALPIRQCPSGSYGLVDLGIGREGSVAANRVSVARGMLQWARQRSGRSAEDLISRFPKLADWEAGGLSPTMRQLEEYAQATHTPIGYLFLPAPPDESLPIPDFRTFGDRPVPTPTPDLLDTIYACEQRQEWYRGYAEARGVESVAVVGSLRLDTDIVEAAAQLRDMLGFALARRVEFPTWTAALDGLREHAEDAGVLVMINGVVGSNTHRKLNPDEFRGFALVDELAPLVFINGADTKAAQIFTLAHELAHVALGGSAISRPDLGSLDETGETERWCNRVASELLVPVHSLTQEYVPNADISAELARLAKYYKVSTLVVLRRIYDAELIDRPTYRSVYEAELNRILAFVGEGSSGGNFYNTQPVRVSKRFARALIADTLEGGTLHRDAFRLLGFKKLSTFEELGQRLGVA
jgi:Zn-dependent peptidase ImmA (M78 family)/transcriptional regulator with XRE-family HTH domain